MDKDKLQQIADDLVSLVHEKNQAYGSAFSQASEILNVLYPDGIRPDRYKDLLLTVRVLDKLFRIANRKDAFGENPWKDIMGYSLLAIADQEGREE